MKNKNSFTEGKILAPLLKFTVPILAALFLQSLYGAVDLLIVGQFGDATGVSAVATGSAMMQTVQMIVIGLTMGATVLIGRRIGERRPDLAGKAVGATIVLFAVLAVLLTIVMIAISAPFARLMQTPPEAFDKTIQYVTICSVGLIFITAYNVISGIFRGIGNSTLPLLFVGIACVVNIVGDLLFVAVFHMDAAGAALATVIAQAVSVILSLVIIRRQTLPFEFKKEYIRFDKDEILSILNLGYPIALQDLLTNISFLTVNSLINGMGLEYSAGYGVAHKLVAFIVLIPSAFMSSMSAFVAQNIGAKQKQRARKAMYYGMATGFVVGVVMFALSFFEGDLLSMIFTSEPTVIAKSADYLKGFSFDCIMVSVLFCFMGYFNGCGKTFFVMLQGLCGAFLVRIPCSIFFSMQPDASLFKMGLATPIASFASIILCFFYYKYSKWNRDS